MLAQQFHLLLIMVAYFVLNSPIITIGIQSILNPKSKLMLDFSKHQTIPQELSSKTIILRQNPHLKRQVREYFLQTYGVYEKLFELLALDRAYYIRAEPLRHPLIFYFGHTAVVYMNKLIDQGVIRERINCQYQKMFAVGVDQMDWDDLNQSHYDWPTVQQTMAYRRLVKEKVLNIIDSQNITQIQSWLCNMWVIMMGIEHERIHLETSAVIIRQVPLQLIKPVHQFRQCPLRELDVSKIPINRMVDIPAWKSTWKRTINDAYTYGWDSEFGVKSFLVDKFRTSQMLVSNGEYLAFVNDGGYNKLQYWSNEGQRWIKSIKPTAPRFWQIIEGNYKLRTLFELIDMPWDWPVQINNLEARAFCKWRSEKTGHYTRLPTEDEYYSIRSVLKKDHTNWEYQSVGNINMEYWMSPNPVNLFKTGNIYDVVGNVWQHTITPIYPFQDFQVHPVYEDFTSPCFDQRHDIIKGGSFISTGNESLYHARYAFRRHFYQFAGFRYIQTNSQMEVDLHSERISDKNVEMNLKHHYLNAQSYVIEVANKIQSLVGNSGQDKKVLTVGCSVGRIPLELGKIFSESIGIDYTTRYFQMSTRLKEKGFLKFKDIDIDLNKMNISSENVSLFQMNPENPDYKKINGYNWIIIDGFVIRKGKIAEVLAKIAKMANKTANFVIINVSGINEITKQQVKQILQKQIQGQVQNVVNIQLQASQSDQSYLPDWSEQLRFNLSLYQIIEH